MPYERFVGFASMQSLWAFNFGHPCPSLVKGELLLLSFAQPTIEGLPHQPFAPHQPFKNRTIPRSALNLPPLSKGGGLTAKHKLLPCCFLLAIYPPFYSPNFSAVKTEGLPQLHRPSPSPQPLQKDNSTLLRTKLASLVKGEVLSPERIRATTGGIVFLPHPFRFSNASVNNPSIVGSASHCNRSSPLHKGAKGDTALSTIPKPHFPSKSTISLPLLSKVRCCRPKEFGRLPEGLLHHYPLAPHQPSRTRTIPLAFRRGASLLLPLHRTSPFPQPL